MVQEHIVVNTHNVLREVGFNLPRHFKLVIADFIKKHSPCSRLFTVKVWPSRAIRLQGKYNDNEREAWIRGNISSLYSEIDASMRLAKQLLVEELLAAHEFWLDISTGGGGSRKFCKILGSERRLLHRGMHRTHHELWAVKCYVYMLPPPPPPPSSRGNMALPTSKVREGKIRQVRMDS
jgi:hypothetical protein